MRLLRLTSVLTLAVALAPVSSHATEIEPTGKFSRVPPVSWYYFLGQTPSQVGTLLSNNVQRIIDVHVSQASPLLLTGSTVSDSYSPYATAWWWYYGQTSSQVGTLLTNNQARLTNLKGYWNGSQTVYVAVMVDNTGSNGRAWSWFPDTSLSYLSSFIASTGDRIVDMSTWVDGNSVRHYSAVTIANTGSDYIAIPSGSPQWLNFYTSAQIQAFLDNNAGARVIDLESEGNGYFLAVLAYDAKVPNQFTNSSAIAPDSWFYDGLTYVTTPMTERSMNHVLEVTGGRIISVQSDPANSQSGQTGFDMALLQAQALPAQSALPSPNNDGAGQFNYLDSRLRTFMRQYGVTGAAIAIAKGGKLVYTRGYGYSDTELNGGTYATPNTLFRVGSISKLITTSAILRLIQEGAHTVSGAPVTLDTQVFPEIIRPYLGLSVSSEGTAAYSPGGGLEAITLREVLNHSAGWTDSAINQGGSCSGNPLVQTACIAPLIGMTTTPTCADLIKKWAVNKPLQNGPGTVGLYSNFGFCVAQTVVDALSPAGYQDYVNTRFIQAIPLIDSLHNVAQLSPSSDTYTAAQWAAHDYVFPEGTLVSNQLVPQSPATVDAPYGGVPMFPGLGTGGWKASVVGLLKLATSINQSSPTGQVLDATRFNAIFDVNNRMAASTGGTFGLGTEINTGNGDVYKSGGVAGGGGFIVYKNLLNMYASNSCANCITWVALVNTAGGPNAPSDPPGGINTAMIDALNNTTVLNGINNATVDLFPAYGLPAGN